jgi:predicted transcriptional regulator
MPMEWLMLLKENGFTLRSETVSNAVYSSRLEKVHIKPFVTEFSMVWGEAFALHLDGEHILTLPSEKALLSSTMELCGDSLEVRVELKKTAMLPSRIPEDYNVLVFSQGDLLLRHLQTASFPGLERIIFSRPGKLACLIIYDDPAYTTPIANPFIAVGDCGMLQTSFAEPGPLFKNAQEKIRERNANVRWNREPSLLPPDAFYFPDGQDNAISAYLNRHAAALCAAFTALHTDYADETDAYHSTYSGLKTTTVRLVVPEPADKEQIYNLFALYQWAYSEKTADKLGLIQHIVSLYLKQESSPTLKPLLEQASEIFEMVKENYRAYIQKSVKSYLDERKQVEDFIRSASTDISKQISGLTDTVTKNLFGLLATAITASIGFNKPENQAYIPWVLYVYGFFSIALTIYYSTLAVANKRAVMETYHSRIADYKIIFLEERINKITGNSIRNQLRIFNKYLHWTVWPGIGISLGAILLGLSLQGGTAWIYDRLSELLGG